MRNEPVYRRRRAVAMVVLLVILALLIWLITAIVGLFTSDGDATPPTQNTADSGDTDESPKSQQGAPANCAADALELSVATQGTSFEVGSKVDFVVTVTSKAADPCLIDASDKSRVLSIRSGNDDIWSSAHCAADEPRELLMSEDTKDSQTITWRTERSVPGCEEGQRKLRAGTYRAQVSLGDATSEELVFTLN
ncbi:hypothetical protein SAMN06309944_1355 [Micrococcales bacterium KH10]|nr:hypothetical protein SAMN06309944_1355 [Micrococcales bacterium KH10]